MNILALPPAGGLSLGDKTFAAVFIGLAAAVIVCAIFNSRGGDQ